MGRRAVLVLCGLLLIGGCSDDSTGGSQAATGRTAVEVTPPSSTVDPVAPPTAQQLNEPAYWNAVLGRLNNIAGNAIRRALSTGKVEPRDAEAVRQVYGPKEYEAQQKVLAAAAGGNSQGLLVPPGDTLTTVQRVIKAGTRCAALDVTLENKAVSPSLPSGRFFARVVPRELREPRLNPTPWAIDGYFAALGDGSTVCSE